MSEFIKEIDLLEYKIDDPEHDYPTFYHLKGIPVSEINVRKMCKYFVHKGSVFKTSFTALEDSSHIIYVKNEETDWHYDGGIVYENEFGIEVRKYQNSGRRELFHFFECYSYNDILAFITSDLIYIDGIEYQNIEFEIDQDRKVFVMYIRPVEQN